MSASREKKNRQDQLGQNDPRTAREAQQRKEERRSNIMYGTIAVVFLLVAIAAIVWRSNIIQKTATAATVDGEKYTVAEVSFYYQNVYQTTVNQLNNYGMLSYVGLDTSTSLKEQTVSSMGAMFTGATEGETWHDYFLEQALDQMADIKALTDAAEADGYTWDDEMQESLDESMDTLETNAATYGVTVKQYLTMIFGSTMTKSTYEKLTRLSILATSYYTQYEDSLSYTDDELEAAYQADRNTYDRVSYQYVLISGAAESTTDDDGNTVDPTDEESAAALAAAKESTDAIYAAWQAGGDLETLAENNDSATYYSTEEGYYSSSVLGEWLFDTARTEGDSAVLEDEDNSTYYVAVFGSRFRYEYNTVDVRHILITPEDSELSSDDEGYEEDVAAKVAEAQAKAEDLLAQWKAGEATEDSFAELANENSEDSGSNTTGGLYTEIYQNEMVTEFNDWCFDSSRKTGDTGIVYNENTGYHVMYFVGTDRPYWKVLVEDDLQTEDLSNWYEEVTSNSTAEQASGIKYVG